MRRGRTGIAAALALAMWGGGAFAQSPATPTPATPGSNPGATATEQITSPTRPPAEVAPPAGSAGRPAQGSSTPAAEPSGPGALGAADIRSLIEAAQATAKATREAVDYSRVVPDLLTQILAKLDKIEDKLDRIDGELKTGARRR